MLFCGFILLCVQLSITITKCFLFLIIHIFRTHFAINLSFYTTWKRKKTMEHQQYHTYEQTKSKQKQNQVTSHSNWPSVLLFDLSHKHCYGIINGWRHCLTSESKRRFLIWLSMMSGHGPNPIFFNKKVEIGRPEYSLTHTLYVW